jgi:hypothetical protein
MSNVFPHSHTVKSINKQSNLQKSSAEQTFCQAEYGDHGDNIKCMLGRREHQAPFRDLDFFEGLKVFIDLTCTKWTTLHDLHVC